MNCTKTDWGIDGFANGNHYYVLCLSAESRLCA
jgi:hypothetical protein